MKVSCWCRLPLSSGTWLVACNSSGAVERYQTINSRLTDTLIRADGDINPTTSSSAVRKCTWCNNAARSPLRIVTDLFLPPFQFKTPYFILIFHSICFHLSKYVLVLRTCKNDRNRLALTLFTISNISFPSLYVHKAAHVHDLSHIKGIFLGNSEQPWHVAINKFEHYL